MVLGLTLGKSKRKDSITEEPPLSIRSSPSLPQLNPTTVHWPSDLITDTNFTFDDDDATTTFSISEKPSTGIGGNGSSSPPSILSRQSSGGRAISFSKSFKLISATLCDRCEEHASIVLTHSPHPSFA